MCHGAPGVDPGHAGQGLRPAPPDLSDTINRWSPAQAFWIVKHGVRMTGMPAWSVSYDDEAIWQLVAFVRNLPEMEPRDYQARVRQLQADTEAGNDTGAAQRHVVEMTNTLKYQPATLTIEAGDTVTWENVSEIVHTVTADPERAADPAHVQLPAGAGTFDSGEISPGGSFERSFTKPGRYRYFCIPHESARMVGELIVKQPSSGSEPSGNEELGNEVSRSG
jgi:plastocyanin